MQDLRLALRTLRATPIVTSVAVLSLALGIGANTAIFSLVNSLLLRPFPVKDPQHLVMVSTGHGDVDSQFNYVMFEQMRRLDQFDGSTAWSLGGKSNLTYGGDTRPVEHQFVSGDYFWTLGVPAILGRTLTPADDVPGAGPDGLAAVISYGLWQTRFGAAAGAVGARVIVDRATVTIVGVTPPQFVGLVVGRGFDITLPIRGRPALGATGDAAHRRPRVAEHHAAVETGAVARRRNGSPPRRTAADSRGRDAEQRTGCAVVSERAVRPRARRRT